MKLQTKKICAYLMALTLSVGVFATYPVSSRTVKADDIAVSNDFETTYNGWISNSNLINVTAIQNDGYNSNRCLKVSNRQTKEDGISSEKGFYLNGDIEYNYSFMVKILGNDTENVKVSLTYTYEDTSKVETINLIDKKINANEWVELSKDYKTPKGTIGHTLTITTDSTSDFCLDNVTITGKSTQNYTVEATSSEYGLKDVYSSNFKFGTCIPNNELQDSTAMALVLKEFNSITCENEMKPDATLVQNQCTDDNIAVSLSNCASILDFCVENNIAVRGHTLIWHSQTPTWFFKENFTNDGAWVSKEVMNKRMESYIKNMFEAIKTQYPTLNLYAYDVANECINDGAVYGTPSTYCRTAGENINNGHSPWVQVYGDNSFVEQAFTYARKYAPDGCKLFYNDYNEYMGDKMLAIKDMVQDLYDKGLLDGIGMQSHLGMSFPSVEGYKNALDLYNTIGCEIQVTELDIASEGNTVAHTEKYKQIMQAIIDTDKNGNHVSAVCVWGTTDNYSWRKNESDNILLFDNNYQPKDVYNEIYKLGKELHQTPIEPPETNENGYYFHDTFETTDFDWSARGSSIVGLSGRSPYKDTNALLVSERTAVWNGALKPLDSNTFISGNKYSFSAFVEYLDGEADSETFYLTLQYTDSNGVTQYSNIDTKIVDKGKYVQLFNANYTIPDGATNLQLVVETTSETMNFYIDEVIGAVAGTIISNSVIDDSKVQLGDINKDGNIDILDLITLKGNIFNDSSYYELSADINQDGSVSNIDLLNLKKYILGMIEKFPMVSTTPVDLTTLAGEFEGIELYHTYKTDDNSNILMTQRFTADPCAMEYNGRVYVYTTNDIVEFDKDNNVADNSFSKITTLNCMSSDDLANWTDHGTIKAVGSNGIASWGTNSWAPTACHKTINGKEKFFLYFCNGANGIVVLEGDSPTGPWIDPLGKPLISRQTENCQDVVWCFDPAVFVDDDGTGYLYFGGGIADGGDYAHPKTARVVKLGNDMTSLADIPVEIDAPYLFEDSGINKIGEKYYYSYCSNFNASGNTYGLDSGAIQYMVSDNPTGPFTYTGQVFDSIYKFFGTGGNNHHSIVNLDDNYYLFYHTQVLQDKAGLSGGYRNTQVDKVTVNVDGTLQAVTGTLTGVSQLKNLNPYETVQAETMYNQGGINVRTIDDGTNSVVTDIQRGDWISVKGINFSHGSKSITVRASSTKDAVIKICTGSANGEAIGYVKISNTDGQLKDFTTSVSNITGVKDLYFVFSDTLEFDSWSFS
ncbi:MAG: endo-1,4-beta-xylanase [Ruminococcus sp.]|nr:endo-1,4-beta-xylanase [Ruminococcus sp.]